jgi:microcystin-dependent protein
MSDPYVGEIKLFAGNFAPTGWALCHGQMLQIVDHETLFQLIGTTYGGDGQETFALPDLRGRVAIGQGTGPGLSARVLGEFGGSESVTVTANQLTPHTHVMTKGTLAIRANSGTANRRNPAQAIPAHEAAGVTMTYTDAAPNTTMAPSALAGAPQIGMAGGAQPTTVVQPVLGLTFIIALSGIFPSGS